MQGTLLNGRPFDSSRAEGREPFTFKLGARQVIPGWEKGLLDMCIGEKRKLVIPPHLAYGKDGRPPLIPGDSTLVFETELVSLQKASAMDAMAQWDAFMLMKFFLLGVLVYIGYSTYQKYVSESSQSKQSSKGGRKKKGWKMT
jgi:hypothetical protein